MNLIGKKVLLREIRQNDLNVLNNLMNDSDIEKYIVGWSKPVTLLEQEVWFKNLHSDDKIRYSISSLENQNNCIGMGAISNIDWKNRKCSIDIKLQKNEQKKGYGIDTIKLLLNYIFEELNFNRIYVNIIEYNEASKKTFEKCGFYMEGIQKEAVYKNGRYHSLYTYALLKKDYIKDV